MDIESFYEQNEARRESAEFEFGGEWTDPDDNEYELSWVEATGELYLMIEPDAKITEDAFGDFYVSPRGRHRPDGRDHRQVGVVGRARGHDAGLGGRDARTELTLLAAPAFSLDPGLEVGRRRVGDLAQTRQRRHQVLERYAFGLVDRGHKRVPTAVERRRVGRLGRRLQQFAHRLSLERGASGGA